MIELVFVVVIIGILAAVAIPKLAATRDDAKVVEAVQNLKLCIRDFSNRYTARGEENNDTASCRRVVEDGCFQIVGVNPSSVDGNLSVKAVTGVNAATQWCQRAAQVTHDMNLSSGSSSAYRISFGGSKVVYE